MADEQKTQNGAESNGDAAESVRSVLTSKELLIPAALSAAAAVAAAKGPDLVKRLGQSADEKTQEKASEIGKETAQGALESIKGGGGGVLGKVAGKALPGGGGGAGGGGGKKTRRLPIQRWTDVAVPVDVAYEEWTKLDGFPGFMHRTLSVKKNGDDKVRWEEKIWFSKRQWEARITDRRKNDRIAWKTTSGMQHYGVVSFHKLDDRLTRVMVEMEFEPSGMMEKMASGLRFVKRAVQADLARFKAQVEFKDAKGLEYRAEQKQEQEKQEQEKESKQRDKRSDDGNDDGDAEKEREEREQRRKERREAVGSR